MSSDLEQLHGLPTGYRYDEALTESVVSAYSDDANLAGIRGATQEMVGKGITYFNLKSFAADLLRRPNKSGIITSDRRLIDCGPDGMVLEPLAQRTGICAGASAGEQQFVAQCYDYCMVGGKVPVENLFIWPYLAGRDLTMISHGDSGAFPSLIAKAYHELGCLPVTTGGPFDFRNMKPHGAKSQEELCVQMRDNPRLLQEWIQAASERKCRVYAPKKDNWLVADFISRGRPVNKGSGYQINVAPGPSGKGVSSLYRLNGGHATYFEGWAIINKILHLITMESWYQAEKFPAKNYEGGRVLLKTDGGDHLLYPGQGCTPAQPFLDVCNELWMLDAPGSR